MTHRTTTITRPATGLAHWDAEYRRPADDIRDLRDMLADGTFDFADFEIAS